MVNVLPVVMNEHPGRRNFLKKNMKLSQLLFVFSLLISSFSMAQADTIDKKKFHFGKISDTSAGYT
jgi:hypothetical protein